VFPEIDDDVADTVEDVNERFGGDFTVEEEASWRPLIRDFEGPSLHLTMYGQRHDEVLDAVDEPTEVLLIVGSQKVPSDVYDLATHNVAVGNQPHSEVAAIATILCDLQGSKQLYADREGADLVIEPSNGEKRVQER
jgi:tRNA (cytidine56-2'-O)-methyltransferase